MMNRKLRTAAMLVSHDASTRSKRGRGYHRGVAVILRSRSSGSSRTLFFVFSFILRLLAIVVCGGAGGGLAWWLVFSLGWTGVGGAIAAAFLGMGLATLLWAGGVTLANALQRRN